MPLTSDLELAKLRQNVKQLYREHIALCVFFHGVDTNQRIQLGKSLAAIEKDGKRQLREFRAKLKAANERIARHYGLRVPVAEIVSLTAKAEGATPHGDDRRLDWLHDRSADGLFPDAVFC